MSEFDSVLETLGLPEKAARDAPRVINRLLGQTFIYQDVEADKEDYYFIHRHRPVVTVGEVREEYRTITGKERDLGVGQYELLLRRLRALGLIDLLDGRTIDVHNADARLRLRGSVRMILPVQTADEMEAWLKKYRRVGGQAEVSEGEVEVEEA